VANTLEDFHSIISGYIQVGIKAGMISLCLIITSAIVRCQSVIATGYNSDKTRVWCASVSATYPCMSCVPKVCHALLPYGVFRATSPRRLSWSVRSTRRLPPTKIVLQQSRKVHQTYLGLDLLSNLHYLFSMLVFL